MADLKKFQALARNWEALGDVDPFYGVLSDPSRHGNRWTPDEFFASGRAHVQTLLRMLSDARASFTPGQCLDFGCGVGRLTFPLSERFERTVGVDVAGPMIEAAQRHRQPDARCEFVINRHPDLRQFRDATFDVVHSSLVLQHIAPDVALRYVAEFFRVCRAGGLVVFQLPAETRSAQDTEASYAMPASACHASIELLGPVPAMGASACETLRVRVTNRGDATWRHDIPAGRHICLGNHWLHEHGTRAIDDDGRACLPGPVEPGATVEIPLTVQAPDIPGRYVLEFDLVQEHVTWFAAHGSPSVRVAVEVVGESTAAPLPTLPDVRPTPVRAGAESEGSRSRSMIRRLLHRLRGATPTFEMHVVPRAEVEQAVQRSGGELLRAVDDNAAGPGWLSYTYICRKKTADRERQTTI